ncbi:hypothetical protein A8C32_01345 [Flavivirga aquatica]|uniref:Uncharacterized protein n=2 Tax=Flavivirga aquatica TaxID=1849968 RepID=A0A1E5T9T7_9FLAO|nr:hypothetical protein A8C32_01345 [Flavivirga aquatica]
MINVKFIKLILIILLLLINSTKVLSQEQIMENKIEKIKALGKDSIVKIAYNILEKKYPTLKINLNNFEITTWSNKKEIVVNFKRHITFIPLGRNSSDFNYNFLINMITEDVNTLNYGRISSFYIPTEEEVKKIEFVKKAFNLPRLGFDNEISEETDMYVVRISNDDAFGIYHIDKITGKEILGSIEGSYESPPEIEQDIINEDPLIEIKE